MMFEYSFWLNLNIECFEDFQFLEKFSNFENFFVKIFFFSNFLEFLVILEKIKRIDKNGSFL